MSATDAIEHDKETRKELLRKKFAEDASGIIEHIAKQNGLTTKEAVCCLPKENLVQVEGSEFTNIMEELSEWGPILMIVHTEDAIIECSGSIPKGRFGRGFYNLEKENSITGHIKADRCTDIFLMRRPFMKLQTVSVQFFNADGNSMYKVFVSRDEQRNLNPEQVKKFDALWEKYEKKAVATA